jgi:hypothetical protein
MLTIYNLALWLCNLVETIVILMPKLHLELREEALLIAHYAFSAFTKKYKNEWLCLLAGLPLLFLYDHPYLITKLLK